MNNYERIKNMSVDEFAAWFDDVSLSCRCCAKKENGYSCTDDCIEGIKQWLESEG